MRKNILWLLTSLFPFLLYSQIVPVGNGSYTQTFPGTDAAGRNSYPSGSPQLSGQALGRPVPTNDWWSSLVKENHASNLFNYPFTLKTVNQGLVVSYIPFGVIDDMQPIVIGTMGLNANRVTISDFSDWSIKMDWRDNAHQFDVTAAIGMPFLYMTQKEGEVAVVTVKSGNVTIKQEMLIIEKAKNGASFAVYAPKGSTWSLHNGSYSSTLNGENYWSIAILPQSASNIASIADAYKSYAYVFPITTTATYSYNEATSKVITTFSTQVEVKEGTNNKVLQGLLPHQWNNITDPSPNYLYSYSSIRGSLKMLAANEFVVENSYHGILPTLPYIDNYSAGFSPSSLNEKVESLQYEALATWTDSYNEGQVMNRLVQTARIAGEMGNIEARDLMLNTVKKRLENWLTAQKGEVAFLFYYNPTWSSLLGYPAGHGQDNNINDHHFHWGYFIHAAAFIEQCQPGWAQQWGEMINLLIRDAAGRDRTDTMFPYLRNFSPYAGHCWANGFATFPNGNDQESTSESMQFNSSLIHWGSITGNKEIRDLGIYLYTTEQTAIEEYWFDLYKRNFGPNQSYSLVSRVWGNSYDNGTFWTGDIAASYGIEMYPIHGGSLYLGHHTAYATKLWEEIKKNTGISRNEANPNLWHDVMWEYLAFTDPAAAIEMYNSYPDRTLKFGVSDAQTYHWLHAMHALGQVDATITADYPIAAAFKKGDEYTYVAHNYTDQPLKVRFSTGYELSVPPGKMTTSRASLIEGKLTVSFNQAHIGGKVTLELSTNNATPSLVEWYDGNEKIASTTTAPYSLVVEGLSGGKHSFYAKIYEQEKFNVSNQQTVIVGTQLPYNGIVASIPGIVEAGGYDEFEGGIGQGISYLDTTPNAGNSRKKEHVDVTLIPNEGLTVSNIAAGEWLEYTVEVVSSGLYSMDFRYACGNNAGGGPFVLSIDGNPISEAIHVGYTGSWETFSSKTITNIPLVAGGRTLRIDFISGELNIGKLNFTRTTDLPYSQPIASTPRVVKVLLPATSTILDASGSSDPSLSSLGYQWSQIYGPSTINFDNPTSSITTISNLEEGIYKVRLKVENSVRKSDMIESLIVVSTTSNIPPTVNIVSPTHEAKFIEQTQITLWANAQDLDGHISQVTFMNGDQPIGVSTQSPYKIEWKIPLGVSMITAIATDNQGATISSRTISITGTTAPACRGWSANGDYEYLFSEDSQNPTLTFIPKTADIGKPTCILYYSTDPSKAFPGYMVTPNVPYKLSASMGSTVYFYYTYSTSSGEKNTMNSKDTYVIGSCRNTAVESVTATTSSCYPNPVIDILHLQFSSEATQIALYDMVGKRVSALPICGLSEYQLNMSTLPSGLYVVHISYLNRMEQIRVLKR